VSVLVLSGAEVREALDPDALVDALAVAYRQLSAGEVAMAPRTAVAGEVTVLLMAAHRAGAPIVTAKVVSLREGGRGDAPSHHAVLVVFDATSGAPVAILDGTEVTAARTAATTRLAVRLLAAPEARRLALLGAGVQARAHGHALLRERAWEEVRVAARRPEAAQALARELGARAVPGVAHAVRGADVVCAATASPDPVLALADLSPGALVTSVGFAGREVGADVVAAARIVVESRAAALAPPPAGAAELAGVREAVELGELLAGAPPAAGARPALTLFKSVGVAVADDVAAGLLLEAARSGGLGSRVEL